MNLEMKMPRFVPLTGRFKRKVQRAQTVHYRPICPECGKEHVKFYKILKVGPNKIAHNVFLCKGCGKTYSIEELHIAVAKARA